MKNTFLLILLFLACNCSAQTGFEKVFGGDTTEVFNSVVQTSDGGFLAGGTTTSLGGASIAASQIYVVKTDANGFTQWTHTFGGALIDVGRAVLELQDGNYLITGASSLTSTNKDIFSVKLNPAGNILWQKHYGGISNEQPFAAITVGSDTIVYVGFSSSVGTNGGQDFFVLKTDLNGVTLDSAWIGTAGTEVGYGITHTIDGGYAMVGNVLPLQQNIEVVKTDDSFNVQWTTIIVRPYTDAGNSIVQDATGKYFVVGSIEYEPDTADLVLITMDANGQDTIITHPAPYNGDYGYRIVKAVNPVGFAITGYTQVQNKLGEMLLLRLDANGDTLWSKHFGGAKNEVGFSLQQTQNGGFAIAGETEGFGVSNVDAYLVVTDANGDAPCPDSVSFVSGNDNFCEDNLDYFTNTTVSSQTFDWTIDSQTFSNTDDAVYYFSHGGNFQIALTACTATASQTIHVFSNPPTSFTYTVAGNDVTFTMNPNVTAATFSWNFGDGSALDITNLNPVHTYPNQGSYWVVVSVTDANGCDSTYIEHINVTTGIDEASSQAFSIVPNPAHDRVSISTNAAFGASEISIINIAGVCMKRMLISQLINTIDIGDLVKGLYFIELKNQERIVTQKLFVQ